MSTTDEGDSGPSESGPLRRALVLAQEDFADYRAGYDRGVRSTPLPYGVNALEAHGYRVAGVSRTSTGLLGKLRDVAEHRSGMPVERAVRALPLARTADVVIALLEQQAMLPGTLQRRGLTAYARTPLVVWSCWLADEARRADADHRRALLRRLGTAALVTHMTTAEAEILVDLGLPEERLMHLPLGFSTDYFRPTETARDLRVLAAGQDRGRDYATLFAAVAGTGLEVDVVCRPDNLRGLTVPDNVRVHGTVPLAEYRRLLQRARVVAVPTHDLAYPTGSSVALEASASGACVVASDTRAMSEYLTDGADSRLVAVGDVDGWRAVLHELDEDADQRERLGRAARASVEARFTPQRMWGDLARELDRRGIVPLQTAPGRTP